MKDVYSGCVHGSVRSTLRFEALAILAMLVVLYWRLHANWILFAVLLLAPDIAMLGYLRDTRIGAWCYNAFHTYTAPVLCLAASLYIHALLPVAIVWGAHIAMDRALGYGLKYEDSFRHTHLGPIGQGKH
jgi:hypothetical protein